MDTIISIDLDILMSPYCGIYNNLVKPDQDRQFNWEKIEEVIDINGFELNQEYKQIVEDIITKYSEQVDKIYVGYDHSTILNAIELEKENLNQDFVFDLYNIDYHHDIYYGDYQKEMIIDQHLACCGNWVGFLSYYNHINKYYWYKGIGGDYIPDLYSNDRDIHLNIDIQRLKETDFPDHLNNVKILYISCSYPWIPLRLSKKLGDFLLSLPQNKIYYLDGVYSSNYDRKKFLNDI